MTIDRITERINRATTREEVDLALSEYWDTYSIRMSENFLKRLNPDASDEAIEGAALEMERRLVRLAEKYGIECPSHIKAAAR